MKTIFNFISDDWKRVKNHCRTTVNKEFTEKEPSEDFKKKLLISEHSPIRLIEFDWSWKGIKYWVSTEWSRHKFECSKCKEQLEKENKTIKELESQIEKMKCLLKEYNIDYKEM